MSGPVLLLFEEDVDTLRGMLDQACHLHPHAKRVLVIGPLSSAAEFPWR